MNCNLRMSGTIALLLKKSNDRRQREALETAFKDADLNGDGLLSIEEYYNILKSHGLDCSTDEIAHLIQIADKNRDGFISKAEFMGEAQPPEQSPCSNTSHHHEETSLYTADGSRKSSLSKAELAFNMFDTNHDGYVTKGEMMRRSKKLTKQQVDAVFQRNDSNHDGKLNFQEFQEFLSHNQQQASSSSGKKENFHHMRSSLKSLSQSKRSPTKSDCERLKHRRSSHHDM